MIKQSRSAGLAVAAVLAGMLGLPAAADIVRAAPGTMQPATLEFVADAAPAPQTVVAGALSIEGATIFEAPGGNGAAYLTIANHGGESDKITAARSDVSASVEFHSMGGEGGMMQMRPMADVVIPPGGSATFEPGGNHIMLIGLTGPLKAGDKVTLTLTLERQGDVVVPVVVTPRAAEGGHSGHH